MKRYYKLNIEGMNGEVHSCFSHYISSCLPMPPKYDGWNVAECSRIEYECYRINSLAYGIRIDLKYTHVVNYEQYFNMMCWILNGANTERRK